MGRKKYISTGAIPYSIDIVVGDRLRTFDFRGGLRHPAIKYPSYSTSDLTEQSLLEKHPSFGKSFILEEEVVIEPAAQEAEPELEVIPFKTVQDAKDWLNKEHGVSYNQILNRKQVIEQFKELNLNVSFENSK